MQPGWCEAGPSLTDDLAGATLSVDLEALAQNYAELAGRVGRAQCAGVVKGNAYGLGDGPVAKTLWQAGCRTFFIARPTEGKSLREHLPHAVIYVLDGLYPGQSAYYQRHRLRPVLTSINDARDWAAQTAGSAESAGCALHVDTGINRLGLSLGEFAALTSDTALISALNVGLLMSHLACADDPAHPMNERQLAAFCEARQKLPEVPASLANSSGIFLGPRFHFDLVRPGIAMFGGSPVAEGPNPMRPVASMKARILQVRSVRKGETVGYGASWTAKRDSRIAIAGAGYRDGVPRSLSSSTDGAAPRLNLNGHSCPIVGRISMDMLAIDVSAVPVALAKRGQAVEVFGTTVPIDAIAAAAGTISYELMTRIGDRVARRYGACMALPGFVAASPMNQQDAI
jgi:alanine racemase